MAKEAIVETLAELERWRRSRDLLRDELRRVERQVAYYEALVADMKREVGPARFADLLHALAKP